jgi:hypothetical protein
MLTGMSLSRSLRVVGPLVALWTAADCGSSRDRAAMAAVGVPAPDAAAPSDSSTLVEPIGEPFVLVRVADQHVAFPDVVRLRDNRLAVVYRQGAAHVDPTGRLVAVVGSADGSSWGEPLLLWDTMGVDDRDPSWTVLADGSASLVWFPYVRRPESENPLAIHHTFRVAIPDLESWLRDPTARDASSWVVQQVDRVLPERTADPTALLREADEARWDESAKRWLDPQGTPIRVTACSSSPVEVANELWIPAYGDSTSAPLSPETPRRSRILFFRSSDGGGSWREDPLAPERDPLVWLQEPALLVLDGSRLLLHVRTATGERPGGPGPMMQAVSTDGGAEWSAFEPFTFTGHAPDLLRLSNGLVVSAFRRVDEAYASEDVAMIASRDQGETWSDPVLVADCGAEECGYPSLAEVADGRLLVVFYGSGGRTIEGRFCRVTDREASPGR